jgi:hypothetical protein
MALTLVSATAAHVTLIRDGATAVRVLDENTGNQIGHAQRIHGFIHYNGTRGSAHEGMTAVVRSTDSTYIALTRALAAGLRNGHDDRVRPMTENEMVAWLRHRGVTRLGDIYIALAEHLGKTEDEMDEEYDRICGRMA